MHKTQCSECDAQGIVAARGRDYVCEECSGQGYFCGDCRKVVGVDDVCDCALPFATVEEVGQ